MTIGGQQHLRMWLFDSLSTGWSVDGVHTRTCVAIPPSSVPAVVVVVVVVAIVAIMCPAEPHTAATFGHHFLHGLNWQARAADK